MKQTTIACTIDKDRAWKKVRGRRIIVLDMNCWINMGDSKSPDAERARDILRKLVGDGAVVCPLSFGLICELYKQAEDSRLRVGRLMEELSLNVSYASREEVFAWEVERAVRRIVYVGPIDLSLSELYVPVIAYLTSRFGLTIPDSCPLEVRRDFIQGVKGRAETLTLTELLKMRSTNGRDRIFDIIKQVPAPKYSEEAQRVWDMVRGDKEKIQRIESETIAVQFIRPAIKKLPLAILVKFMNHLRSAPKDKYGGCLGELIGQLPSIYNHMALMAARTQQPSRKNTINDYFDNEIMPVPLAYATVFVAQDKGIRDVLRNRTDILAKTACRYCFDLAELERWLDLERLA